MIIQPQDFANRLPKVTRPHGHFCPASQVLDLPDSLSKLIRPGNERDPKAAFLRILQLLADLFGFGKHLDAQAAGAKRSRHLEIIGQALGAELDAPLNDRPLLCK